MKKASVKIAAIMLCLAFAVGALPSMAVSQSEIDELEKQRDRIKEQRDNISAQLTSLESDMESLLANKSVLDQESALLQQEILVITEQVSLYEAAVADKKAEVERTEAEAEEHHAVYAQRVRDMEEHSNWSYLDFILKADNLSELLSRLMDISDVMTVDENLRRDYLEAKELAELALGEYEAVLEAQQTKLGELEEVQLELEEKISESSRMIEALEADIDTYMAFEESAEAEFAKVQEELDKKAEELRKQQEAEAAAQQPTGGGAVPTGGYFIWPSDTSYITSYFGPRVHPIYGQLKAHSGVDIGAAYGTPIYAAASGTVTMAVLDFGSTGYGTYVAIYHSNGTTTLYGHMSSLAVSSGQSVSRGQVIGYVGSTGASTGPHIHYEIRQNGACTDPMLWY